MKSSREAASAWADRVYRALSFRERDQIQSDLVLGGFTWEEWFPREPPTGGLSRLSHLLMLWEISHP